MSKEYRDKLLFLDEEIITVKAKNVYIRNRSQRIEKQ